VKIEGGTSTQIYIFATFCEWRFCLDFLARLAIEEQAETPFFVCWWSVLRKKF
jgi:hypothetical protein